MIRLTMTYMTIEKEERRALFSNEHSYTQRTSTCVCQPSDHDTYLIRMCMSTNNDENGHKEKTIRPIMSFVIEIQWESLSQDQFHMSI